MIGLCQLRSRLAARLLEMVRSGQLTERALARTTGVSQPHIHHVLKGKRSLSVETSDVILTALSLDALDLLEIDEVAELVRKRSSHLPAAGEASSPGRTQ